jgi:hypothetical protein
MKTLILLGVAAFTVSGFASDHIENTKFDYKSIALVTATMNCAKEYSEAMSELRGPNAGVMEATIDEGGQHDYDQKLTLKFGVAHPMFGVKKTKMLVIDRLFMPAHCPAGAADCGGGSYEIVCTKSDIDERN